MLRHLPAVAATLLIAGLAAQQPAADKPDPVALVGQAETLLKKQDKETEDAALLLWQALDQLAASPANPIRDATALSARFLLQEHDPREPERRRVFTSVATQQLELAAAYRTRKWLETAATRLAIADRYDREAGAKERAALEAAKPKPKPGDTGRPPAAEPSGPVLAPLLQRAATSLIGGIWTANGDCLVVPACTAEKRFDEWVTRSKHEDNEIAVELRPSKSQQPFHAAICVGLHIREGESNYSGLRCYCQYHEKTQQWSLFLWEIAGMNATKVVDVSQPYVPPPADGFHRLSVQVSGNRLRLQVDNVTPVEIARASPIRGFVGLMHGLTDVDSCEVQFRNFRIDPLPADAPTDEELRQQAQAENQNAIAKAVDEAKDLLGKKQPEAAALRLREALERVDEMSEGVLRDNLRKTIDTMLGQADPLAAKRKKAARTIADELGALADAYATAGWVRAALALTEHAAAFDPESQASRRTAIREKVTQWNVAQATARAAELQPPVDDGAKLREWFAKGRKLDTSCPGMVLDDAVARAELGMDGCATWLPHPLAQTTPKASVHVRLPANGTEAGMYFDVVDHTQLGLVTLRRRATGLRFSAWAKLAGKWVPLLHRDVPMDAWRLDAWHAIRIEANDKEMIARFGTTELKVARSMLGKATGTFGLQAVNDSKNTAVIEFRAFQPGQ